MVEYTSKKMQAFAPTSRNKMSIFSQTQLALYQTTDVFNPTLMSDRLSRENGSAQKDSENVYANSNTVTTMNGGKARNLQDQTPESGETDDFRRTPFASPEPRYRRKTMLQSETPDIQLRMEVKPTSNFGEELPEFTKTGLFELAALDENDDVAATHSDKQESSQSNLTPFTKD